MSVEKQLFKSDDSENPMKFCEVDGFFLTESFREAKPLLDDWEVYDEDVWISGSPKTGTTWVQEMAWLIVNDLDYEGAKTNFEERTPYWESTPLGDMKPLAKEKNVDVPDFRCDTLKFIKETKVKGKPMCIKTHMPFNLLPKQIRNGTKKPKIIFIARDPKDCFVSFYYFAENLFGYQGTFEELANEYLSGRGTNWTQEMVWLIENDLDFEGAKQELKERVPHWEISTVMNVTPFCEAKGIKVSLYLAETLEFIKENKVKGKPMCLKSHMPFNLLPNQIKDGSKTPKIIYIARDPKDSVVSLYHFFQNLYGYEGTLEDIVEEYLRDEYMFAPVWDHTISYWNERNRPNLLIITYEDMIKDLPAVINKVATFLGKKYTSEQIRELANHLSFENMKGNKAVNFTDYFDLFKQFGRTPKGGNFIRLGKVGSYKDELSPEMIEKFNKIGLEKSKESGWKFV